jgi:phospholipase D1/2
MPPTILRPPRNVWRIARAERAAVLVDGAAFFRAVREAFIAAQHSVFVLGWDLHSQTRLVGEGADADDGYPVKLIDFLRALVERRPGLAIHLLLWDYSVLYAIERELFPSLTLHSATPLQIRLCLDNVLPLGASQHQKIIVVDDAVAFSGGLDLTIRRWDTPEHVIDSPQRTDPAGRPYAPFHDIQAMVDGEAARALAELARERWARASCSEPEPICPQGDPWPRNVPPDLAQIDVGIARTQPRAETLPEIREVEALFLDSIDAAERAIYVENQFLTSLPVAQRLARRLRQRPNLEAVIVAPHRYETWHEAYTMRNGRIRFWQTLQSAGVADRVRLVSPEVTRDGAAAHVMIHSKVMVVDDRLLRVGSANINNRSMGTDTECDLAFEATTAAHRGAIEGVRNRLLGEHCGVSAERVAEALARHGSLVAVADRLGENGHRLQRIDDGEPDAQGIAPYLEDVGDPDGPIEPDRVLHRWRFRFGALPRRRLAQIGIAVLVVLALSLAWHVTPLAKAADIELLRGQLNEFVGQPWAPLVVLAAFVAAGLVAFPVTILIAATAAAFGPWLGLIYGATGALVSALVTYAIGAMIGKDALHGLLGARLDRVRARLDRQGVIAIAAIRLVPVAPFTLVNLAAGAAEIRLRDYVIGTLLGLAPGLVVLSALGHQIVEILTKPTVIGSTILLATILAWIAASIAIQVLVSKRWSGRP